MSKPKEMSGRWDESREETDAALAAGWRVSRNTDARLAELGTGMVDTGIVLATVLELGATGKVLAIVLEVRAGGIVVELGADEMALVVEVRIGGIVVELEVGGIVLEKSVETAEVGVEKTAVERGQPGPAEDTPVFTSDNCPAASGQCSACET